MDTIKIITTIPSSLIHYSRDVLASYARTSNTCEDLLLTYDLNNNLTKVSYKEGYEGCNNAIVTESGITAEYNSGTEFEKMIFDIFLKIIKEMSK